MSTNFLDMTPEQIAKDLGGTLPTGNEEENKAQESENAEKKDDPPPSGTSSANQANDSKPPAEEGDSKPPAEEGAQETPQGGGGSGGGSGSGSGGSGGGGHSDDTPLDVDQVQDVSSGAFKEAYDYYKKNAVGDPKTREKHLRKLRDELAEYEDNEDGTKTVNRGLLKNFTDENYANALAAGMRIVEDALHRLSGTDFPDFESFKAGRENTKADVLAKLQKNVAYAELNQRLVKGLEDLSTKMQLKFNVSRVEREKEQVLMGESNKDVERQRMEAEYKQRVMNSQQLKTNVEMEQRLLQEQNEKQYREWKERIDLESKLRERQITEELKSGFEDRANRLRMECATQQQQTLQMLMQMQKESQASQARLTQFLLRQKPPPPVEVVRPPGLLGAVGQAIGGILGKLL